MIFSERIETFILAVLVTQEDMTLLLGLKINVFYADKRIALKGQ